MAGGGGTARCWGWTCAGERGALRFYDPATEEYLPTPAELRDQRDAERAARLAAETALRRLREQLRRLRAR